MGPPRCLKVSTWCRACEFRRPRLQRSVARARDGQGETERERKARPRLGPQQLPTKAFTKSAPSFHSVLASNHESKQWELDRTGQDRTPPPLRGSEEAGGGRQHTLSVWHPLPDCHLSCCFHWPLLSLWRRRREHLLARAAQRCQVSSESGELTETNIYPSNCHSSPLLSSCSPPNLSVPPLHHRRRPPELTDSWGRFPKSILAQICCCCLFLLLLLLLVKR